MTTFPSPVVEEEPHKRRLREREGEKESHHRPRVSQSLTITMESASSPPPLSSTLPVSTQHVNHSTPLGLREGLADREGDERLLEDSMEDTSGITGGSGGAPVGGEGGKKRKVFPFHITSELKSLYRSGMIGVGVQYSSLIETACIRTGLSKAQVKSWIKRTKYHQRKILKQDEERYNTMTQEDDETEDEPVSLYCPTESEGYADQGGVVFVKNEESPVESIPLLRRHVVMPRESEGLDISSVTRSDKRGVAGVGLVRQLPVVHSIESNRMEVGREGGGSTSDITYHNTLPAAPPTAPPTASSSSTPAPVSSTQRHHPPALLLTTNGSGSVGGRGLTNEQHVSQEASRVFRKIERNFKKLEELGYQGFAFGIHGDDIQLVNSSSISHCFTPPLLSYLRAVIVAANPPPLIPHTAHATPISSSHGIHVVAQQPSTSSTPSTRHYYMYEPARVQQRTEIYELNDNISFDAATGVQHEEGPEHIRINTGTGTGAGNNGKVHVVLTCDPNLLYTATDNDELSD